MGNVLSADRCRRQISDAGGRLQGGCRTQGERGAYPESRCRYANRRVGRPRNPERRYTSAREAETPRAPPTRPAREIAREISGVSALAVSLTFVGFAGYFSWARLDSNQGHTDYETGRRIRGLDYEPRHERVSERANRGEPLKHKPRSPRACLNMDRRFT